MVKIHNFFIFWHFLTTLDPLNFSFFFFYNALGLSNIFAKSFWKSGKNWNFGDFLQILTFSSFFLNDKIILRKKLHNFFDFSAFFYHFRSSQIFFFFFFFVNGLGLPHIFVKSFWKSGKNWNFGDFLKILTFSSFFSNEKMSVRKKMK